jgi:hypothetical protein
MRRRISRVVRRRVGMVIWIFNGSFGVFGIMIAVCLAFRQFR